MIVKCIIESNNKQFNVLLRESSIHTVASLRFELLIYHQVCFSTIAFTSGDNSGSLPIFRQDNHLLTEGGVYLLSNTFAWVDRLYFNQEFRSQVSSYKFKIKLIPKSNESIYLQTIPDIEIELKSDKFYTSTVVNLIHQKLESIYLDRFRNDTNLDIPLFVSSRWNSEEYLLDLIIKYMEQKQRFEFKVNIYEKNVVMLPLKNPQNNIKMYLGLETDTLDQVRNYLAKELSQDKRLLKFCYHSNNNITIREVLNENKSNSGLTYEKLSKPEAHECTREELVKIIRELFKQKVIIEQNRLFSNAYRNHLHDCIFTVDGVDYKASLILLALQSFPHGLVYCLLSSTIDSVEKHSRAIHIDFNDRLFAQFDKNHLHQSLDFIIKQSYTVSEEEFDIMAIQALLALCEYLGLHYTNAIKCVIEDDYYQEFSKMTLH